MVDLNSRVMVFQKPQSIGTTLQDRFEQQIHHVFRSPAILLTSATRTPSQNRGKMRKPKTFPKTHRIDICYIFTYMKSHKNQQKSCRQICNRPVDPLGTGFFRGDIFRFVSNASNCADFRKVTGKSCRVDGKETNHQLGYC